MKRIAAVLIVAFVCVLTVRAQAPQPIPHDPAWAFQITDTQFPAETGPKQVPGSTKTYTPKEIDDLLNPPDWFPDRHPPAPEIVMHGHGDALACGVCHLMNGLGHPESGLVAGFTTRYIEQQIADFKNDQRKDMSVRMNLIAKALTDKEIHEAAEWFSKLPSTKWTEVKEAAMVPKTVVGPGRMRFLDPKGGMEAIGNRIITLPMDAERARERDPNSGFIAYVPPGSIARGRRLATTGGNGKTIACTTCHGDGLKGLGNVPHLAGLHPIYVVRQIYLFKDGNRKGVDGQLMKKPIEHLTDADIVSLAAYIGSLPAPADATPATK